MKRSELEHAIRAACDLTGEREIFVFGSQAILAQYPDAPAELRHSSEVDMAARGRHDVTERIDAVLGLDSDFHRMHGFYVDGVPIEAAILPKGWERRVIVLRNTNTRDNTGLCVEAHDLAASKLAAFREKDREFVRVLIQYELVEPRKLLLRVQQLPKDAKDPDRGKRLKVWLSRTLEELGRANER